MSLEKILKDLKVKPHQKIKLHDYDLSYTAGFKDKDIAKEELEKNVKRMTELQYLLYAESKKALLIVLQGMDAAGKDGTIRHVMSGMNPQGCKVTTFKVPSVEEASHDYLWRIHKAIPPKGDIGIFNRSHYEDVLVVRVRNLVAKSIWARRYDEINAFEKYLAENDVTILKFFLYISKDEQKKRLEERLKDKDKNWKISPADVEERKYWSDYIEVYEDAISKCSMDWAPWFVIPADKKWFRNLAVSKIIVETMEKMNMKFPKPKFDLSKVHLK